MSIHTLQDLDGHGEVYIRMGDDRPYGSYAPTCVELWAIEAQKRITELEAWRDSVAACGDLPARVVLGRNAPSERKSARLRHDATRLLKLLKEVEHAPTNESN